MEDTVRRLLAGHERAMTGATSLNGWRMEKAADGYGSICTRPVPGTSLTGVQIRLGDTETILVRLLRRFHGEVRHLHDGDVTGWLPPAVVRDRLPESNLASGTALRILPGSQFYAPQIVAIRSIVSSFDGLVRWGGDDVTVDESLFYVDVPPADPRLRLRLRVNMA